MSKKAGMVYLVGAGPWDPKLLTLRGNELLEQADVVVYDHLVSPRLLKACPPRAKLVYVGKESDRAGHPASGGVGDGSVEGRSPSTERRATTQEAINALLAREARSGKAVVRLKGGDPFVFGRGGEEALALAKAKVPYEVVPGVTSAFGVPAYAGIPVTHRTLSSSVTIITGHEDAGKPGSSIRWKELATACDTLICLMGVRKLPGIARQLARYGRRGNTPCAVIEWGTRSIQRTVTGTLATIATRAQQAAVHPPAILIVGEVVRLRDSLRWFERKPLFGRRVLVTRASDHAGALTDRLEALGAEVEELPAIELGPVKPNSLFREAIEAIPNIDWVFFTSPEGIGWFVRMLKPYRKDLRWLSGCHIAAIGAKTAVAIEERGLHVDFIPKAFSQEGLLNTFPKRVLAGKHALILSAEGSRDALANGLRHRGMRVRKVAIYRTVIPVALRSGVATLFRHPFDAVTVTSASCVEHLFQALRAAGKGRLFRRLPFASIGPVTSGQVRAHGGRVMAEGDPSTVEGVIEALLRAWAR